MSARQIAPFVRDKIKAWEGLRLKAYQDDAGVWTVGFGRTSHVSPNQVITEAEAEIFLSMDLLPCETAVTNLVTVPLTDGQFGALVSFAFNLGVPALSGSTLLKMVNQGRYADAPAQFMRWNKLRDPKTKELVVSQGLTNRRQAECEMWNAA